MKTGNNYVMRIPIYFEYFIYQVHSHRRIFKFLIKIRDLNIIVKLATSNVDSKEMFIRRKMFRMFKYEKTFSIMTLFDTALPQIITP